MLYKEERKKMAILLRELYDEGLLNIEGGGVSLRISKELILASPTGAAFRRWRVEPRDILVTNKEGGVIERGRYLAMAEYPLDLYILNSFKKCNAVFHVHGQYSLVYASKRLSVPMTTNHVQILGKIPCLKSTNETGLKKKYLASPYFVNMPKAVLQRPEVYIIFKQLIKKINNSFKGRADELERHGLAFTVEKHGLFCFARSLEEAIENAVRVEAACRTGLLINLIERKKKDGCN
ncbi:class II aldolase/adducin family protein [Patescibacteria group bacterium]|nr:class II aldolase/adducin family protein [Patescibacteria group bacterium]MBU4264624.1 class II aldolase/adducin family protein [Patescibacteria group bacterium]MBU4390579.1 class II aldolase/adducin family protein [Patescibacteria group bacterium]MBU4397584.1 class II aldolase/adducin family protein [Patescibacteria group bacterium]MBU4431339.1 class II aldolase/adducin family protein [Patescibacteria group bacterium]